ncbi:ribosomal protein S5 domain 2-like protein [Athelia psychrophila]|uniref:Ribosomal protein S5 domain 2-like protein n=1 Tax=Athelia psychrophila TaxID=1759441 RepID=A0A166FRN2_9AGAM|nr:ribosomal protein S5 domain 2-like protein [Fibularhizoctonia sp. CBS 109695]
MSRHDGRANDELRKTTITYERLDRVDGSARFIFGETAALASLSGPMEVRLALEHPSRATLEVILRPLSNMPGTEAKSLASTIRTLLTPALLLTANPRSLLQLVLQSLSPGVSGTEKSADPRLVAAMVNASTLALLNAGSVPMQGVVCAVAVGLLSPSPPSSSSSSSSAQSPSAPASVLVLDPSDAELRNLQGSGCFAFMFSASAARAPATSQATDEVLPCEPVFSSWQASPAPFSAEELFSARALARAGAATVWAAMKDSIGRAPTPDAALFSRPAASRSAPAKGREDVMVENGSGSGSGSDDEEAHMEI